MPSSRSILGIDSLDYLRIESESIDSILRSAFVLSPENEDDENHSVDSVGLHEENSRMEVEESMAIARAEANSVIVSRMKT